MESRFGHQDQSKNNRTWFVLLDSLASPKEKKIWSLKGATHQLVVDKKFSWLSSHVFHSFQEYGDLTIGKMKVADFQGFAKRNTTATGSNETQRPRVSPVTDAVPSGDVPMEILWRRLKSAGSHQTATDIRRKIRHAEKVVVIYSWPLLLNDWLFSCSTEKEIPHRYHPRYRSQIHWRLRNQVWLHHERQTKGVLLML